MSNHQIQTEKFTGPIAVLHEMIESRKLSISDFSLVSITEDFVNYVKSLGEENFSREEISQFISVASVLILLKSKSLLPELELTEDENRDIAILENQLKAFEIVKSQSKIVAKSWQKKMFLKASVGHKNMTRVFAPDQKMQISYFHSYILNRLEEIVPKEEDKKEVKVHKVLKIEDALSHVRQIIKRIKTLNFKNLNDNGDERLREKNKRNVVILFLAVLELVKIGEIDANQKENFSDILVNESNVGE
jgi:segregation and condensation protein A